MSLSAPTFHFPSSEAGRLLHVAQMLSRAPQLPSETKQIYRVWILGYLRFLERHNLGDPEPEYVRDFLKRLSKHESISDERRQQAAEALVFFHEVVLDQEVTDLDSRLEMMSTVERRNMLAMLKGQERILAKVVFTTELDLAEALRLRVGDVDVKKKKLMITDERGCTKGVAELSDELAASLKVHLEDLRPQYDADRAAGHGAVDLPEIVHQQFPDAHISWVWQYVFPSQERTVDPRSGRECRYPMQPTGLLDKLKLRTAPMRRVDGSANESANECDAPAHSGDGAPRPEDADEIASNVPAKRTSSTPMNWDSIYS